MKACSVIGALGTVVVLAMGCGAGKEQGTQPAAPESAPSSTPAAPSAASAATPVAAPLDSAPPPTAPSASDDADSPASALGAPESRTTEVIAALVKAHRKEARACYENASKQVPGLKGDVVIHFTLKPGGEVKTAELNRDRSTITEPLIVNCVISVISAIEFPKSSKGMETTVNYPFNFNP